jgi:hypothetical protein
MNIQPALPQLKLKLDWKAYYNQFSEKHGGTPIIYKGKQLFADGWTYSSTDYAGPEWPPSNDSKELHTMQLVYWYTRWNRAKNELMLLRNRLDAMKGLQESKDVPLQQVVVSKHQETNKTIRSTESWSPRAFEYIISFLEDEVTESDKHLTELKGEMNGQPHGV